MTFRRLPPTASIQRCCGVFWFMKQNPRSVGSQPRATTTRRLWSLPSSSSRCFDVDGRTTTNRNPYNNSNTTRCFSTASTTSEDDEATTTTSHNNEFLPSTSQPLGHPMPTDEHACSVSLPTWSAVVGYEEGVPAVTNALLCGYPRFVYHPYVKQLMAETVKRHGSNSDASSSECLVLPTHQAATRCKLFLQQAWEGSSSTQKLAPLPDNALIASSSSKNEQANNSHSRVSDVVTVVPDLAYAVVFPAETAAAMAAKAYWQHTGEVVSSRRAATALCQLNVPLQSTVTPQQVECHKAELAPEYASASTTDDQANKDCASLGDSVVQSRLKHLIASWVQDEAATADHVFLTPSGMASIYTALRSARRRHYELQPEKAGGASIVYGFPYLDTLKLCSRPEFCPDGVQFFGKGNASDLQNLTTWLQTQRDLHGPDARPVSVLFTEVPSNPLLHCPDLLALRQLADEYDFCLAVDDTIANFLNVDLIASGLADVVCTSLTKLVSGRGDAMAGSCVVNPHTAIGRWMQQDLQQQAEPSGLYCPDAHAILQNAADFAARNRRINATAEAIGDWLAAHDDVARVYYPKHNVESLPLYHQLQNDKNHKHDDDASGRYGGLFSIVLHSHVCQRTFYDALDVAKGPSLGTNFTLVCPYTLLAHYHELDFAMSYNVPPNLLRFAIGLEDVDELKRKFQQAFSKSRLYPKLDSQASS